jgi:hypothetical protein
MGDEFLKRHLIESHRKTNYQPATVIVRESAENASLKIYDIHEISQISAKFIGVDEIPDLINLQSGIKDGEKSNDTPVRRSRNRK